MDQKIFEGDIRTALNLSTVKFGLARGQSCNAMPTNKKSRQIQKIKENFPLG